MQKCVIFNIFVSHNFPLFLFRYRSYYHYFVVRIFILSIPSYYPFMTFYSCIYVVIFVMLFYDSSCGTIHYVEQPYASYQWLVLLHFDTCRFRINSTLFWGGILLICSHVQMEWNSLSLLRGMPYSWY